MDRKIAKVSVDLQNADQAEKQIANLNKGLEKTRINLDKVQESFKKAPQIIDDYIKQVDKINKKGHLEGSVTSRDKQALDVRTGDVSSLLEDVVNVVGSKTLLNGDSKINEDTLKELNSSASKILSALGNIGVNASISTSYNHIAGVDASISSSSLNNAYAQNTRDNRNRDTAGILDSIKQDLDNATGKDDTYKTIIDNINSVKSTLQKSRSTISNSNRTLNNIDKSTNAGKVSYARNQQYQNFFSNNKNIYAERSAELNGLSGRLSGNVKTLDEQIDLNKKKLVSTEDTAELERIDKKIQELSALRDKVNASIDKVSAMSSNISASQTDVDNRGQAYNQSLNDGEVEVGINPNSLGGRLRSQAFNIVQRTLSQVSATIMQQQGQGNQARTTAYNNGVGAIMFNQANNGNVSKKMDNSILKDFTELGLHNGTHYSGTELSKLGGAYASSSRTGNISDYRAQTDAISQMARFNGMDLGTASSLIQSAGFSGATSMIGLSQAFSGSLQRSNMVSRSNEQAQALSSIYNNVANVGNLTNTEAGRTATFQGIMAQTKNSALQGQQGAMAYTEMANGLTNTQSNYARELFAMSSGNTGRYSGRGGSARLSLDMEDARQDPTKMKGVLDTLNRTSGGDKDVMAQQLQEIAPNLSMHQAVGLVGLYQKGDFSKKKVDRLMQEDKEKGKSNKNAKKAYSGSGQNTIDFSIAVDEKGAVTISKATDSIRGVSAHLKNNPLGAIADVALSGLGSVASGVVSGVLASRFRGDFKFTDIWNAIRKKPSSDVGSKSSSVKGTHKAKIGKGGKLRGILGFGKDLLSGIAQDLIMDKIFGGISSLFKKGKGVGKGVLGLGKGILKGVGKSGIGTLLKAGIKRVPLIAGIGIALGGAKNASDTVEKMREGSGKDGLITGFVRKHFGDKTADSLHDFVIGKSKKKRKKSKSKKQDKFVKKQNEVVTRFDKMLDKAEKVIALAKSGSTASASEVDASSKSNDGKSKASDWKDDIKQAAKEMGQTISDKQVDKLVGLIQAESGGNADIGKGIDDGDGTGHAIGLLQYKQSTFDHYAVKGHTDINNGYDQLLAFFNNKNWASDLDRNGGGPGGWGPTGSVVKHANGGFFNSATMRGTNNVIGENGLEVAIPLNADKFTQGKALLKQTAGLMGQALIPQHELSLLQSRSNQTKSFSPSYNLDVTIGSNTTPDEVYNQVLDTLNQAQTQNNQNNDLLNYYAQDIRGI